MLPTFLQRWLHKLSEIAPQLIVATCAYCYLAYLFLKFWIIVPCAMIAAFTFVPVLLAVCGITCFITGFIMVVLWSMVHAQRLAREAGRRLSELAEC